MEPTCEYFGLFWIKRLNENVALIFIKISDYVEICLKVSVQVRFKHLLSPKLGDKFY